MGRRKVRRVRPVRRLAHPLSGRLAILALTTALGLGLVGVPVASGDPGGGNGGSSGGAFPSQEQVDRAKARAEQKAHDVAAIKARLLMANQRLEAANVRAEQASEAYNGAMWRLEQAKQAYRQARADAQHARRTVAAQRNRIGALVAQSYQNGGDLSALNAMMSADGPPGVMDQYVAFQGASTSLQADYKRFAAVLVGLRDQRADAVPLGSDGTTGVLGVGPGLTVGLLGLLEAPHRTVVGLGGLLGTDVGGVEALVGQQQPRLDRAYVVGLLLRTSLGPVDLLLAGERSPGAAAVAVTRVAAGDGDPHEAEAQGGGQTEDDQPPRERVGQAPYSSHASNLSSAHRAASLRLEELSRPAASRALDLPLPATDPRRARPPEWDLPRER